MSPTVRVACLPALAALLCGALASPRAAQAAPDPFYLDRLRDGIQAYERNDFAAAAKQLRLACFGLLDEPQPLAACLTRLGAAQAAAGDAEGFAETFRRIAEIEERFGAYGKADLPPELRAAFEQRVIAAIPAATLDSLPAFKELSHRKLVAQTAALAPRERRRQLDERLRKDPKDVTSNLLLVELDLAEGRTAPAATRAEQAAALAPREPWALCLRGLTRAAARRCADAVADLASCTLAARDPRYGKALEGCRVELARTAPAKTAPARAGDAAAAPKPGAPGATTAAAPKPAATGTAATAPPQPGAPGSAATQPRSTAPGSAAPQPGTGTPASAAAPPKTTAPGAAAAPAGSPSAAAPPAGAAARLQGPLAASPDKPPAAAAPPLHPVSAAERDAFERSHRLLVAKGSAEVSEALRLAGEVAAAHPEWREAQLLAGEAAYRNSRWKEAVGYFRRAGDPGDDQPEQLFYLAVSLYETGDRPAASQVLKRSLPRLQNTPFVVSYSKRILGQ
jgi:tetratricopeptide (TPR) repeat protein